MIMYYGHENSDKIHAVNHIYEGINTPDDLYNALKNIWCEYSCTPRLRDKWTSENITLGQCSITAFLAQDIFGGKVFGILMPEGNYHCYNVVDDIVFDLTSEQFEGEKLNYANNPEQSREIHFSRPDKHERYEYIKNELKKIPTVQKS